MIPGRGALLVAASLVGSCKTKATEPLRVAAASDLSRALPELGALYEKQTGQPVVFTFGSSGLLSRQIKEGAPFAIFAAASPEYARDIGCRDERVLAKGALAIVPSMTLAALADKPRIAIANPEHAPYGAAAKKALGAAGLWSKVEPKIVYGDNVNHTLQLQRTGNVDAVIVARALVYDEPHGVVEPTLYTPLTQVIVVCKDHQRAGRFADFLVSDTAAKVLVGRGFLPVIGP